MTTSIRVRRGNRADLPASAPSGMLLWCEDTKELFIGIGDSVIKIGEQSFVSKSGDSMNGPLAITLKEDDYANDSITLYSLYPSFYQKIKTVQTQVTVTTTAPSEQNNFGLITMHDASGHPVGELLSKWTPDNNMQTLIRASRIVGDKIYNANASVFVDAKGNTYFSFPKCTTKPTTASSATANKVAVVVENYKNGTSWKRVWSDGWIEQGGSFASGSFRATKNISLLKSYTGTDYSVFFTSNYQQANGDKGSTCSVITKAKSSFTFYSAFEQSSPTVTWYACGY